MQMSSGRSGLSDAPEASIAGFSEYIEEHVIAKSSRRLVRLGVDRVLCCLEHNFDEGVGFGSSQITNLD